MPTVFERIQTILTDKFHVPPEKIRPDATLESLGLDSLDLIEVLFEVEEAFNIRVPQDGAAAVKAATLQDIIDNVEKLAAPESVPQASGG
jgi:acyl carrier protein